MSKKKEKPEEQESINVGASRKPQKKTVHADPFARINLHPLEELEARESSSQILEIGNPSKMELATQTEIVGLPTNENLGIKQPKPDIWQPKTEDDLGIKQPKLISLATQTEEEKHSKPFLKKYDKARSTEPLHARVEKGIAQRIRHFIVDQKMTLKDFMEVAAVKFIDEFGNPNENSLGAKQPYDDRRLRLLYKTQPSIINLYLEYNSVFNPKTKWSVKDDDAASKFNDIDLRLIELGIIQTQGNKNFAGKINSFGYYAHEIQAFIDLNLPTESVETMLEINRKRWQMATGKSFPQ